MFSYRVGNYVYSLKEYFSLKNRVLGAEDIEGIHFYLEHPVRY